ncbi:MAG: hypothetical protein PWR03_1093 [Tenuifilum sp.]|uniref:PAS domain S-box protein n=1 Tax=Tenuifilum sp. TaxID=2760880 RepID=UPI0024AACD9B|nr:PAS domain S-box protein [Tenuifilum sp.]MDI3526910.1 hypothetical protein [Tenuifilum sp.]
MKKDFDINSLRKEFAELKAKYLELRYKAVLSKKTADDAKNLLEDVQARNQALLEANPDLMFVFDRDGNFLDYNAESGDMYAVPESFIGKKVDLVLPPDVAKLTHDKIKALYETNQMQIYDYQLVINGELRFFESRMVKYGQDKALAVVRDITERKNYEFKIKERESKYQELYDLLRLLADTTPDMIWAKDVEKRFIFVNKAICRDLLNAKDTNEPIGKTDLFFALRERERHPENPEWHTFGELCMDSDEITMQEMRPMQFEEFGNIKGKFVFLDVHKAPLLDKNGKLIGVVGTARDITKYKEYERQLKLSEETYRGIINSISEAVYIQDENGIFLDVNDTATKIYGFPREYFIGKSPEFLSAPGYNDLPKVAEYVKKAYNGEPQQFEFWGIKHDGSHFPKVVSVTPGKYFGRRCVIAVARDITERKKWENDLIEAKAKAEENDKLKSAFLANMSHEIRTPLNGILGFVQLMKDPKTNKESFNRYLDIIEKSGERLNDLLNGLIDLAKIESGQIEVKTRPVKIFDIYSYLYEFFKFEAEKKGLSLLPNCKIKNFDILVETDPNLLQDSLVNILKNAVKYTDKGHIEIGCEILNGTLDFWVSDTGIGIPDEKKEAIFERFVRANEDYTNPYEGAGLGLSIAKVYVEKLGGQITLDSTIGIGSVFHVKIPVKILSEKLPNNVKKEESSVYVESSSLNILIADDDYVSALLLKEHLLKYSKNIKIVSTVTDAVEAIKTNPKYNMVFMDIKMPGMNGYKATQMIKEINPSIKVIAQTAFAMKGDEEKALAAGCDAYISKPIDSNRLGRIVEEYSKSVNQ